MTRYSDLGVGVASTIVAVIDSGLDLTHPEFAGRILPGYDFANEDDDPMDDVGHGTHVAGIIGAAVNNNLGVAGVAGGVSLMPVKVLDADGLGTSWWLAQGIVWAADHGGGRSRQRRQLDAGLSCLVSTDGGCLGAARCNQFGNLCDLRRCH